MARLEGKVAIVTGAARGTGAITAKLFADEGAQVVLADVRDDLGAEVAEEIGAAAVYRRLDITSEEDWSRAVSATVERFGTIDVLVNNAAVLLLAAIDETTSDDFMRVLRVNLLGPFLGIRTVSEVMKRVGAGSIVNISSTDGLKGMNGVSAYASSKWGVRGLTKSSAIELGKYGIRVNTICPEAGNPEMTAPFMPEGVDSAAVAKAAHHIMSGVLKPREGSEHADRVRDVAHMALFLASDESASCTAADFVIDAGLTAGSVQRGAPGA